MRERIVVTGMGVVTPIGLGVGTYWKNLLDGVCGIAPSTAADATLLPVGGVGEVKDYRPRDHFSARMASDLDRFMQFSILAAEEAIAGSGLPDHSARTSIVMGTALAGVPLIEQTQRNVDTLGKSVPPKLFAQSLGNIAACQLAVRHQYLGTSLTVSTACSAGGDAVTTGTLLLRSGAADAVVVMAGETPLSPLIIQSLWKAGAMSTAGKSLPFDANRDGFVAGEGGGALILETESYAKKRGAPILAELLGVANNNDAFHPMAPHPEGEPAARCMEMALADAGISAKEIDYLNAHGTATIKGDLAESKAIDAVFGHKGVVVSSTKGATGHMMGAGGLTESVACIQAIQTGWMPANLNDGNLDPDCDLNLLTKPTQGPVRVAMSNALGFGGQNSSLIFSRYQPN